MDPGTMILIIAIFGVVILVIGLVVIAAAASIRKNFGNEASDLVHIIGGTICQAGVLVLCLCLAWYLFILETKYEGIRLLKVIGGGLVFSFAIYGLLIQGLLRECPRKIRQSWRALKHAEDQTEVNA